MFRFIKFHVLCNCTMQAYCDLYLFCITDSGTHSLLTLYRNRDDVLNYVGAGGM